MQLPALQIRSPDLLGAYERGVEFKEKRDKKKARSALIDALKDKPPPGMTPPTAGTPPGGANSQKTPTVDPVKEAWHNYYKIDPQGAGQLQKLMNAADDRTKAQAQELNTQVNRSLLSLYRMPQGPDRDRAWEMTKGQAAQQGYDVSRMPQKYDKLWVQNELAKSDAFAKIMSGESKIATTTYQDESGKTKIGRIGLDDKMRPIADAPAGKGAGGKVPANVAAAEYLAKHIAEAAGRPITAGDRVNAMRELQKAKSSGFERAKLTMRAFEAMKKDLLDRRSDDEKWKAAQKLIREGVALDPVKGNDKVAKGTGEAEAKGTGSAKKDTAPYQFKATTAAEMRAEFEKNVKSGQLYVNPADGAVYRKK